MSKDQVVRGYAMSGYFMAIGLTDWLGEERTCCYIGVEVEKPTGGRVNIFPLELHGEQKLIKTTN